MRASVATALVVVVVVVAMVMVVVVVVTLEIQADLQRFQQGELEDRVKRLFLCQKHVPFSAILRSKHPNVVALLVTYSRRVLF